MFVTYQRSPSFPDHCDFWRMDKKLPVAAIFDRVVLWCRHGNHICQHQSWRFQTCSCLTFLKLSVKRLFTSLPGTNQTNITTNLKHFHKISILEHVMLKLPVHNFLEKNSPGMDRYMSS